MTSATLTAILAMLIRVVLRLVRGEDARHWESNLAGALKHLEPPPPGSNGP